MTQIILSWLNEELRLSKHVQNIQSDFKNGYLFAQILQKYKQQSNFSQFVNKDDKKSKLNNFSLLFQTFKSLQIKFDNNIVNDIIHQKLGVSKKILYQLKMHLEKPHLNLQSTQFNKSLTLTPLKRVSLSKQKKDSIDFQFFKKRLYEQHRAQKKINQDNVLKKFSDFHKTQIEKNKLQQEKQYQKQILAKQLLRNKLRNSYKKAVEFRHQWQRSNQQKWKQNISLRMNQNKKDIIFQNKFQSEKKKMENLRQTVALKQVGESIQQFQNKLARKKRGRYTVIQDRKQLSQSIELNRIQSSSQEKQKPQKSVVKTNVKIKKNAELQQAYRKQRDKRRRKMIFDQNKQQNLIEYQKRQLLILSCIKLSSNQQKQLQYEIWKAWQNKLIIVNNRQLRNTRYKQRIQLNQVNRKFKNEQILKILRQQHNVQLKQKLIRQKQLQSEHKIHQRQQSYNECYKTILNLVDITFQCYKNQQTTNIINIQNDQYKQYIQMFLENKYSNDDLARIEMKNYLQGKQKWNYQVQRINSESQQPEKQNSIPNSSINNFYLGNILKKIFTQFYVNEKLPEKKIMKIEFGICVLGLQFTGKRQLSQKIANKYNLHIINIQNIIQTKLNNFKKINQSNQSPSSTDQILYQTCIAGKKISDSLFTQLIKQQIQNHPRFLLINYPNTYQQSILLTEAITNIQTIDRVLKSKIQMKIQQFSRLAQPTESIKTEESIKSCGIDIIVWIDIKPQTSLDRCIGRRWIGDKIYHISQDIHNDIDRIKIGERGASVIQKNNFKLINLEDLRSWYKNFGIKLSNENSTLKCWNQLEGEKNKNEIEEDFEKIIKKVLQYKKIEVQNRKILEEKHQRQKKQQKDKLILQQQKKNKCVLSSQQQISSKLNLAFSNMQLNDVFVNNMAQFWNKIEKSTIQSYLNAFNKLVSYREEYKNKITSMKIKYISLLTRCDSKFLIVKNFQFSYNQFIENNLDMLEQQQTKQQLHQKIQDLEDQLINLIETKKQQAIYQRNQNINSGWLEQQLQKIYLIIQLLVVNQIERSLASQQIISDYYSVIYSLQSKENSQFNNQLMIQDNLQIFSNQNQDYPRINKLFEQANRIMNKQQIQNIDDKNKKGGKVPMKKQQKKSMKKGGKQQQGQQKKELKIQQMQMMAAINIQKSIFRYRMNILKQFSKQTIKNTYDNTNNFYKNLQDLLYYSHKTQMETILKITKLFRQKVQKSQKIQNQFQINYINAIISQKILNFYNPKEIMYPAIQIQKSNTFTISQLKSLIQNIKSQSEKIYNRIINRKLSVLLTRYTENIQTNLMFPQNWRIKTFDDYEYLVSLLDSQNRGYVELKDIFTLFILSDCKIISNEQKNNYQKQLRNNSRENMIDINNFCKVKTWFDNYQTQPIVKNINTFNRPYHMKQLLFEVIKDNEKNQLNIDNYLKTISFETIKKDNRESMTYQQLLFKK